MVFSPDGTKLALLLTAAQDRIVVWSVADGKLAADLKLTYGAAAASPVPQMRKVPPMTWLPGSDGWLVGGNQIVDDKTGVMLYRVADHKEAGAEEFGPRRVVDKSHILMSFKSLNKGIGMQTLPLPAATIAQVRAAIRANGPAAAVPQPN